MKQGWGQRSRDTVDGRNPAQVEVGSFPRYLQGFIHPFGGARRTSEPSTCGGRELIQITSKHSET